MGHDEVKESCPMYEWFVPNVAVCCSVLQCVAVCVCCDVGYAIGEVVGKMSGS